MAAVFLLAPSQAFAAIVPACTDWSQRKCLVDLTGNIMTWLLGITGIITVIFLVIAGARFMTSAGNEEQVAGAKKALSAAIIGVVIILGTFLIIKILKTVATP